MKKLLARWGVTLGLVGSTLLGCVALTSMQAQALPEEAVLGKLRQVPVFTITNAEGAPLVAAVPNGENVGSQASVAGVFISKQAAEEFVERLKTRNPDLGNAVQVVPVSLAEIYQIAEQNKDKPDRIIFDLVPMRRQVDSALSVLRSEGQELEKFPGVPLFFARGGEEGGYLTLQRGEQQVIPFFFNKEDLQGMLDRFKEQSPNQVPDVEIKVVNLQKVLEELKSNDDPQMNRIVLIPSRDSVQYVRSLQGAGQNQLQPARP